jgi:hypothetical protein
MKEMKEAELLEKYFDQILTYREKELFKEKLKSEEFKQKVFEEYLLRKSLKETGIADSPEELELSIWEVEKEIIAERKKKKMKLMIIIGVSAVILTGLLIWLIS